MKAVVLKGFGGAHNFVIEEVAMPQNTARNVLVKIKATAFNPIDYQMRQGATESKLLSSPILGRELSGIVTAAGSEVDAFSEGDEVVAYVGSLGSNGTYAEYISIPQELLALKPRNISFEQAAALPMVGLTALQCYERLAAAKHHSLFIGGGAGGVGTMLIKLFISNGYRQIITAAGSSESKDHLLSLGVPEENILEYRSPVFAQNLLARNNGRPFDYCIDLVGGEISEVCSEVLKVNGVYTDITYLATNKAKELLFDKGATIVSISNYAYTLSGNRSDLAYYGRQLQKLLHLIDLEQLTPPPIHLVGGLCVESVQQAHSLLENNQAKGRKLVMKIA
ncbi:quinone oxidoreductase family protein [Sabulibacter ruber]|uniref:quinone oxidoreductase family protein n=1 Tax=Sabulibacter ruber TaxID=2811901 RepID=UPI001A962261|nr:NADP-dependent oxidoreductase [Sabulibacter ruber]